MLMLAGCMAVAQESPYRLECELDPADGLLKANETAKITVKLFKNDKPAIGETLRITTKWETATVKKEDVVFDGNPIVTTYTSDKPGWVYWGYQVLDADKKPIPEPGKQVRQKIKKDLLFEAGAIFDADKIVAVSNRPDDFEQFWKDEMAKVKALPIEAKLTPLELPNKSHKGKIELYSVVINCIGNNPVTGYFAMPVERKDKSLPIIIDFQSKTWSDGSKGVPCHTALKANALAFYMTWHGMETGHPAEWYVEQKKIHYALDFQTDINDNVKWIYHNMFYRVLRTLDYMKTRPEWNGKDLIVRGGSLGGIETIAAAALDADVTMALISVPGSCDYNAMASGRRMPAFGVETAKSIVKKPDVVRTLALHDAISFAPMIKCETYVCTGFADELCFPSNVFSFYNALTLQENVKKFMSTSPYTGHYGTTANTKGDGRIAKGINSVLVSDLYENK